MVFNRLYRIVNCKMEHKKFRPIVVSGPSGGGKSTILKKLFEKYPNSFAFSVSRKYLVAGI